MTARLAVRVALGLAMSVAALVLLGWTVDLPSTLSRLTLVEPAWLAIPLVVLAIQLLVRSRRWAMVLGDTGGTRVLSRRLVGPLAVGYLANAVLPVRLGELARTVLAARRERLPLSAVAASVVMERVVDLAALLSIGLLCAALIGATPLVTVAAATALILVFGVLTTSAGAIARHLPGLLRGRVRPVALQFLEGVAGVRFGTSLACYGLSALAWTADIAVVWASARALGIELGVPAAAAIAVGAALGTALPAVSGYLGTYELGAVAVGSLAGTSSDMILAVAVLAHVFAVVPMALAGLVAALRMGVRFELPSARSPREAVAGPEAGRP